MGHVATSCIESTRCRELVIKLPFAEMEGAEDWGGLQVRQVICRRVRVNSGVDRVLQCFIACAPLGNWCSMVLYSAEI